MAVKRVAAFLPWRCGTRVVKLPGATFMLPALLPSSWMAKGVSPLTMA